MVDSKHLRYSEYNQKQENVYITRTYVHVHVHVG